MLVLRPSSHKLEGMGGQKHKKRGENDLRALILDASRRIVLEDGFSALTMRRVARTIGYSATTLYLYFENREAIVAELGREALDGLAVELEKIPPAAPASERLRAYAETYLRYSAAQPDGYRLIFMESSELADAIFRGRHSDGVTSAGARAYGILVHAFAELQTREAAWARTDPARSAEVFWTSLHGLASLKITCGRFLQTPTDEMLALMVPALLRGLAGG